MQGLLSRFFILDPLAVHGWRDHMSPPCTLVERFWRLWQDGLFVKSVTCVASMSTIVSNPSLSAISLNSRVSAGSDDAGARLEQMCGVACQTRRIASGTVDE